MLPTNQFERDLADLEPDAFEQLVFAVVRKEHPNAERLKAPDFGADVLDDPASKRPRVWQVKHYLSEIHWSNCEKSLDRAVAKWRPGEVTFVFPRDLTGKDHQDFNGNLVGRKRVSVTRWTATELNEALEAVSGDPTQLLPASNGCAAPGSRAARLTETTTDGPAFLEHGINLAEIAAELDPRFDYELTARPEHLSRSFSDPKPFMSVRVRAGGLESVLAAWVKPGTDAPDPSWSFTEDDGGDEARRRLYRAFAQGETVELSEGISVRATPAPTAIAKILEHVQREAETEMVLSATPTHETVPLRISFVEGSGLRAPLNFEMRAVPPKPGDDGAWVGLTSGVLLYLGFRDLRGASVRLQFSPMMDLGASAGHNAVAAATLLDLLTHPVRLDGPLVGGKEPDLDLRAVNTPEDLEHLRYLIDVYGAVIEIEARTGTRVLIHDPLGCENARTALNLAQLLRQRVTTGSSQLKMTLHVAPNQAGPLAMRLSTTRQIAVPFEQDLMDQTVRVGWARLTFERVRATLRPPEPNGHADVRVEADGEIEVRLIEAPLPSDVALDTATGRWSSEGLG